MSYAFPMRSYFTAKFICGMVVEVLQGMGFEYVFVCRAEHYAYKITRL